MRVETENFGFWWREREIFVFHFFVVVFFLDELLWWILSGLRVDWNIFMHGLGPWAGLRLFYRYWKKVGFCKLLSFYVSGCHQAKLTEISKSSCRRFRMSYILTTRWKVWLGYFGRDLACILDLMYWMWHKHDMCLKLITCRSYILSNVSMHWMKTLLI